MEHPAAEILGGPVRVRQPSVHPWKASGWTLSSATRKRAYALRKKYLNFL
jgi:hypothetical protein